MATSYTSLLGLALPVTGELAGTWGDTVNNAITSLLDTAVAGTTTLSTDADVTLSTTVGATNQARQAILLCSGARAAQRTITAPAQSKIYAVVNNTTGGFAVKIVGVGPTTGVTVANGKTAIVIWNGADFVEVAPATAATATNLAGGAAGSVPYQTGAGATTMLGIGAQYRVLTSTGSAPQWSNELQNFISISSTGNITGKSLTAHPTLIGKIDPYDIAAFSNTTGSVGIGRYAAGSGFTTLGQIFFISGGSTQRASLTCAEEASGAAAYLAFATRDASNVLAERVRISAAGNVGIGTSSPTAKVDIQGTGAVALLCNQRTDTTSISTPLMFKTAGNNYWALRQSSAALTFYQDTAIGGTATEYMRIDSAGNLGVGTNNPTEFVYISKSQDAVTRTRTDNSSTGTAAQAQFSLRNSAASLASFGLTGGSFTTSGIFRQDGAYLTTGGAGGLTLGTQAVQPIYFAVNSTELMRLDTSGRLLIGTTASRISYAVAPPLQTEALSAGTSGASFTLNSANTEGVNVLLTKTRGTTAGSNTTVVTGDTIGNLYWAAADGTNTVPVAARISAHVEGTVGTGIMPGNIRFATTGAGAGFPSERMRIDSAGNVGIGTATPTQKLDVYVGNGVIRSSIGGTTLGVQAIETPTAADQRLGLLGFGSDTDTFKARVSGFSSAAWTAGTSTPAYLAFHTTPTASVTATERMRISAAGVVGVGTSAPSAWAEKAIDLGSYGSVYGGGANFGAASNLYYNGADWIYKNTAAGSLLNLASGGLQLYTAASGTAGATATLTQVLSMDVNGNVGIGTPTPGTRLDIANTGAGTKGGEVIIRNSSARQTGNYAQLAFAPNADYTGSVVGAFIQGLAPNANANNPCDLVFGSGLGGAPTERMRIDSAGNVGVGTSTPVNKLQVNGSFGRNAPVTKTGNFTLGDAENWLICNGTATITVTLPAASSWTGREVMLKTIAAFTVVSASSNVVPLAGGAAGTAILAATAGKWVTLVSDGTNWITMAGA
jgi:hypothetical protein